MLLFTTLESTHLKRTFPHSQQVKNLEKWSCCEQQDKHSQEKPSTHTLDLEACPLLLTSTKFCLQSGSSDQTGNSNQVQPTSDCPRSRSTSPQFTIPTCSETRLGPDTWRSLPLGTFRNSRIGEEQAVEGLSVN